MQIDRSVLSVHEMSISTSLSFFKSLVQKIKMALRKCGFNAKWTDNEIKTLLRRSLAKQQSERVKDKQKLTEKNAARFAIIGEQGAAQLDKYSKQNNLDNLQIAKEMLSNGEDPKTIKLATGWEKGGDGKWRMEIPDVKLKTVGHFMDGEEYERTLWDIAHTTNGTLEEYFEAPELFAAYPQLKDINFKIITLPNGYGGWYSKEKNEISVSNHNLVFYLNGIEKNLANGNTEYADFLKETFFAEIQDIATHEIQHAIQAIEGFAKGGTLKQFEDNPAINPTYKKVSEDITNAEEQLKNSPDYDLILKYSELIEQWDGTETEEQLRIEDEINNIYEQLIEHGTWDSVEKYFNDLAFIKTVQKNLAPIDSYKLLAGEVEARNASERTDMSVEEKRQTLLSETEDVAEESKIYLFDNGGESAFAVDGKYTLQNVKNRFERTKAWMKAPNGKSTNLSEFQWLQTHTDNFKEYFGDWEMSALLQNIEKAWNDKNYNFTFRFSPSNKLKQKLEELLGHEIKILQIDSSTVRHIKNRHSNYVAEAKLGQKAITADDILLIPYLLNNFDLAELSPTFNDNKGNRSVTVYKRINGISVIGTIERGKEGVYIITNWETVSAVPMSQAPGLNALSDADKNNIQRDIAKIKSNAKKSSKIIDENGEPLIVYHGTNADFNVFDTEKFGAWFSKSMEYAESMMEERGGDRIVSSYLSIQNPMTVKMSPQEFATNTNLERRLIEEAKVQGHDGLIIENDTDNEIEKDIFYVAFYPTQIKSATDNIGTFDPNNPDVRYLKDYDPNEPFVPDSDKERMITVLMGVGKEKLNSMSGEEAKVYLEERLFDTDENTAQSVLNIARTRYKEIIKSYQQNKKTNWINENYPFYRHLKELGGENAKIYLPKSEIYKNYKGQFFTRKKGEGVDLDVLVNKIAEIGFDGKDLKEKVLKFFDGLTTAKLTRAYRESLIDTESKTLQEHENYLLDKLKSKKTFSKREEKEIKTLKEKYIALGLDLNIEDIAVIEDKPQIQDVSEQKQPKKKNTKTLTADEKLELQKQYRSELKQIQQKYATLYNKQLAIETEKLQEDYRNSIKELKKAAYDDKRDIKNVQKIAANFAHKFLPTELHKKFTTAILNLSYKSNTYGKGELLTRRRKALNQLLDSIAQEAQEFERKKNLEILQKKLDSIHSRVNQSRKKVTTRNFETQETLDHIVEISRMSDSLIAEQLEDLKNEHEFFLASGQDTAEIEYQLKLYKTFGSLQNKNATDLQYAIGLLSEIERNGRNAFKELLGTRRAADAVKINYLINTITRGKGLLSGQSELQNEIKQLEAKFKRPKEELLKLFKMEDFIYILSAANKGKDWIETPLGKIYQRVHNSQVNKDTMLRTFSEKYNAAIDKALGSTNAVNRASAVQKLRKRIEKTGIYVYGFNTAKDVSYIKMDIETARNKLADFDSGKKNMPFYQAEFLRDRLESLDIRMQKTYKREKTDGITEHILTELDKIEKQDNFKSIAIPVINLKSKKKTEWTNVNQMELLTLYLLSRQRDARYKLFFTGFDDYAIKQAEKLMLPELKQLADDMTKYLSYLGDELDKVTMNLYGTKLDRVPFYFPLTTRRVETDGKKLKEEKAISENAPQALSLGSLKKRNAHIMQIEIGDAFDTFHRHALKTIHYISWAETARELRAVFMNKDAVKAMNQVFGKEFYQEFQKSIVDTVNGGNIDLSDNKTLKFLVSNATSIKMMFNYLSGLKQIPSFIAYSNDVPLKAVMKGMSYALRHPKQVFDVLNQTPYFKNRLESGPDIMARLILDRANRISGKKDAIVGIWNEWGSIFTRYGDATALILGGYGVYKYHYDRMIEQGFSHEEANRHALTRFEMSTESLMQSGAVHMQNAWQRNGIGGKLLTAWKSSQILNSQRALREMFSQAYFGNYNNDPFAKDIKSYKKYLEDRIKNNNLFATEAEKKKLLKFYKDFPLGKVIKNKWGESLIFAPQDYQDLNDYIQHFAVKRGNGKENFSQNYLELFPQIEKSLQDPDERILTMVNDTPRISYLKKIQTKNGNHLIITSITPDGRIIFWTHMDAKGSYILNQRKLEKDAVEQYGLMDGNGNRVYMSYDKYLQQKADIPLYLATAEPNQVGNPQAELLDRNINLAQKNDLSSKIGKNSYTGAEISNKRHKIWLAQIINSMVVSTFVKFIGDFAGGYGAFGDDDDDDNLLEHIADYLMSMLGEQLSVFPIVGDIAQIGIGAISDGGGISSTDKYMFFDEAKKGFWATKKLIDSEAEAEEIFDIASQMLRTAGLMNRTSALLGSTIYQAKRLYDRVFGDDEK